MNVRLRRLQAEFERISQLFAHHDRIRILESFGNPPERYVIEYRLTGLVEEQGEIKERGLHRAQIVLGRNYPRELPRCSMLTPVFHPNIDHLRICTEDIGSAGKTIDQVITFIGEMIAYQTYNVKSPLNGDAARWTIEHLDQLPLDRIDLTPKEALRPPSRIETATPSLTASDLQTNVALPTEPSAAVPSSLEPAVILESCVNCGQTGPQVLLRSCANQHLVCEDCSLACQNCAKTVCVLCNLRNCSNCHRLVCDACQVTCETGHPVCGDCSFPCASCARSVCVLCELRNCSACQALICPNCLVLCAGCGRPFCSSHVHRCKVCNSLRCSDCLTGCKHCGDPCCGEHLNSAGICTVCDSASAAGAPTPEVEDKVNPDQSNASTSKQDPDETITGAPVAPDGADEFHSEQRENEAAANSLLDPWFVGAQIHSAPAEVVDPPLESVQTYTDPNEVVDPPLETVEVYGAPSEALFVKEAEDNGLSTDSLFRSFDLMTAPVATAAAVGVARDEWSPDLSTLAAVTTRPTFSISNEEVRQVPETALHVPFQFVQVSPVEKRKLSGKAVAALIFGLLGIPLMGVLVGPVAILFGGWALHEIERASHLTGRPLAFTGLVLGIFDIILWIGLFVILYPAVSLF